MCKIFDVFTPFTVGLVYILYCHFDSISIIKPLSSRPANSERYIICKGLKERSPQVITYLFEINDWFNHPTQDKDIQHIVDLELILFDTTFTEYIRRSNIQIIKQQIEALRDLLKYIEDPYLDVFSYFISEA